MFEAENLNLSAQPLIYAICRVVAGQLQPLVPPQLGQA
jgi:hypothetical protein